MSRSRTASAARTRPSTVRGRPPTEIPPSHPSSVPMPVCSTKGVLHRTSESRGWNCDKGLRWSLFLFIVMAWRPMLQPEANQRCRSPRAKVAWRPSLASGFDLDRSCLCLCGFRDRETQHPVRQARLDFVGVKLARQRELALEVAHLILLVDEAMPFRRMLVHLSMNGQGASLQRDRHAL